MVGGEEGQPAWGLCEAPQGRDPGVGRLRPAPSPKRRGGCSGGGMARSRQGVFVRAKNILHSRCRAEEGQRLDWVLGHLGSQLL